MGLSAIVGCDNHRATKHELQREDIAVEIVDPRARGISGGYDYVSGVKRFDYTIGTNRVTVLGRQLYVNGAQYGSLGQDARVHVAASAVSVNGTVAKGIPMTESDLARVYPIGTFRCLVSGVRVETQTRAPVSVCENLWGHEWLEVGSNRLRIVEGRVSLNGEDIGSVPVNAPIVIKERGQELIVGLGAQGSEESRLPASRLGSAVHETAKTVKCGSNAVP